jgi:hypothetical protein
MLSEAHSVLPEQSLTAILYEVLQTLQVSVPANTLLSSHSLRIGTSTSLQLLRVPPFVIRRRMGWQSESMLAVYFDERLELGADDLWFFGQFQ